MNDALYDTAKYSFWALFGTFWRMRARGTQNVPRTGPLIVACNHVSYFDPPVLGTACPRRLQYMAKAQLFEIPVLGPLIHAVGAYPVDREGSARMAIKRSLAVLQQGGAVGIFPEGTRNRTGEVDARGGVALLASLSQAPVVPAAVVGTDGVARFKKFEVRFGAPLELPKDRKAGREDLAHFTDEVMRAIRSLQQA